MRHAVVLAFTLAVCVATDARAERLPVRVYNTTDGLAHNTVNRIVRDSRGFLWFCTADGLSRFDGYSFRTFGTEHGLPHPTVSDLLETSDGEYFVATRGGVARFEPRGTPRFVAIASDTAPAGAAQITVLREGRDGAIWVGTNNGLYRLNRSGAHSALVPVDVGIPNAYPEQREVTDVLEDRRGSLWISALSGLYRRWPDGSAARYTRSDGLPTEFISDLFEDHEGQLWVGTRQHGFFRLTADGTRKAPAVESAVEFVHGVPFTWVFGMFESSARQFWVGTTVGLAQFFPDVEPGGRLRSFGERSGISDFQILAIAEDLGGNLWLGTRNLGAVKITRRGFTTYGPSDGIRTVDAAFEDAAGNVCFRGNVLGDPWRVVFKGASLDGSLADELWVQSQLGCFDGKRFEWFNPAAITNFGWVVEDITLRTLSGEWWIGSGDGVYRYAPVSRLAELKNARPIAVYTEKDGLPGPQTYRLFEDSHGDVWISTTSPTTHGLARWEQSTGRIRDLSHMPGLPPLEDDVPRAFGEDRAGNVWIGFNSGLARVTNGAITFFTSSHGVPPGAIRDVHVDGKGRVWLASAQSGLVRVDEGGSSRPRFTSYTTARGLSSNTTDVLTEDAAGHIFVGGGRGLDRLDPETGRVRHFTTADGLPPGLFRAAFRDRDGALWFGTSLGLARLAPGSEATFPPPPVWITGLRIRGEPQLVSALGERDMALPDLSPQRNQLQVEFVGLSFVPGDALRYQYRLEGAIGDWSAPSEQRTVTFATLSPGRYRFIVRAVNSSGTESERPATLAFTILRPFWQRGWFIALVVAATAFGLYGLYRYRLSRLLEIANMRTRIATDLHDDVGANLTRIVLLTELARQAPAAAGRAAGSRLRDLLEDDREDKRLLSIARIARESVSSMSDIVWAINPRRESLLDLIRRMRQHADELFTLRGIELRFTAPDGAESLKLGVDVRRDLLLIFKEAVSNAARHSRCSVVTVDLRREGRRLVLTVADNGIGFNHLAESEGQGRFSMLRRAQRLKGTLEISSTHHVGTTVSVSIPI